MHGSMKFVTYPGEDGGFVVVAVEDLVGAVDEVVPVSKVLFIF